jgi:thiamine-monophosphate kinase
LADTLTEFGLIARHFRPLATYEGALALTDDACVLQEDAARDTIVTADALTAGIHFLEGDPPNLIASKALRVNLSDLAAKGAVPAGYLLTLALPRSVDDAWLACFARGLAEDQAAFGISLLGGDTTATPGPLTIAITALGHVPRGTMIRRSGAKVGDHVFVSGTIGDAGAGLALLQGRAGALPDGGTAAALIGRYRQPTPRLGLGVALRGVASASLDVSDGLLADLGHIAEVSGVRIVVEAAAVPRSDALRRLDPDGVVHAVTAGDDYEIAFTAASVAAVETVAAQVSVARIGRVEAGQGVVLVDGEGHEIPVARAGFTHF